jgi:hypothetical protein
LGLFAGAAPDIVFIVGDGDVAGCVLVDMPGLLPQAEIVRKTNVRRRLFRMVWLDCANGGSAGPYYTAYSK